MSKVRVKKSLKSAQLDNQWLENLKINSIAWLGGQWHRGNGLTVFPSESPVVPEIEVPGSIPGIDLLINKIFLRKKSSRWFSHFGFGWTYAFLLIFYLSFHLAQFASITQVSFLPSSSALELICSLHKVNKWSFCLCSVPSFHIGTKLLDSACPVEEKTRSFGQRAFHFRRF